MIKICNKVVKVNPKSILLCVAMLLSLSIIHDAGAALQENTGDSPVATSNSGTERSVSLDALVAAQNASNANSASQDAPKEISINQLMDYYGTTPTIVGESHPVNSSSGTTVSQQPINTTITLDDLAKAADQEINNQAQRAVNAINSIAEDPNVVKTRDAVNSGINTVNTYVNNQKDKVNTYVNNQKDNVSTYVNNQRDKANTYLNAQKDKVNTYVNTQKDKVNTYVNTQKDKVNTYVNNQKDKVNTYLNDKKDKVTSYTNAQLDKAKNTYNTVKSSVDSKVDKASSYVHDKADKVNNYVDSKVDKASNYIHDQAGKVNTFVDSKIEKAQTSVTNWISGKLNKNKNKDAEEEEYEEEEEDIEEEDFGDEAEDDSSVGQTEYTMTTKIETNGADGSTTTETSERTIKETGQAYTPDESTPDLSGVVGSSTSGGNFSDEDTTATPPTVAEQSADVDVNYSGIYNERQMIPDVMAIACQINAEEVAKDINKLYNCVNKYVVRMNSQNAAEKLEGMKDFEMLRYRMMLDLLGTAVTKSMSIGNYEKVANKYAEAASSGSTKRDDEAAIVNTTSVSVDVINSLREAYAEQLKYQAINGISSIDPSVIAVDGAHGTENTSASVKQSGSAKNTTSTYSSQTTLKSN